MKALASVLLALLCISVFCQTGGATIRRVPLQYATIQAAINAAAIGDTVLVDEGTYKENIVIIKKITVGSRFVVDGDTAHIAQTVIDGSQPHNSDSAAVVTIDGATDTTTVVAGFTITGGKGNRRLVNYPGMTPYQMFVGMGVDIAGGGARIHHNVVRGNNCSAPAMSVGGVINIFDVADKNGVSYAIVERNTIADNALVGSDVQGGAFAIGHNSTIRENVIARNTVQGSPSAGIGAGFQIWNGIVKIERNRIINNRASHEGGGLYANAVPVIGVAPNIQMVNNILTGNIAGTSGGGLFVMNVPATVNMVNNTLVSNTAAGGGAGLVVQTGAIVRALNTILWDSSAFEVVTATSGSLVASYCDVYGGFTGTGNINSDPLFTTYPPDTLRFQSNSPCRDAGVPSATVGGALLIAPSVDIYGRSRPQYAAFDIGAWEGYWPVSVKEISDEMPSEFALQQNYPNPFNPSTTIRFSLPHEGNARLTVFNLLGQQIAELVNEHLTPGTKQVTWDAKVATGVYLYRLDVVGANGERFTETKRMTVLR